MGAGIFSVPCPCNDLITFQCDLRCLKTDEHLTVKIRISQFHKDFTQFERIFGHADQGHFKQTVLQIYPFHGQIGKAADRFRVCDHSIGKLSFDIYDVLLSVFLRDGIHMHMVGSDLPQFRSTLKNVGKVPQLILEFLGCLIRCPCEKPECSDICEIIRLVEQPQITAECLSLSNNLGRHSHVRRNSETGCKIIGCAGRDIADRHKGLIGVFHHAGDYFVQRSVPACTRNIKIVIQTLTGKPAGITAAFRRITNHFKFCRTKCLDNIQKIVSDL